MRACVLVYECVMKNDEKVLAPLWDGPRTGINHGRSKKKSKLFRKKTCIISTSYIVHSSRNNCHSAYNCHKFCATSIVAVRRCSKEAS